MSGDSFVEADREPDRLRVARMVEADMADAARKAWRSASARQGLSDHAALEVYADSLTRWSERLRMAFDGKDYRDDRDADKEATR